MNSRNGKIARLSRPLRDQLNQRLDQSQPGPQLLAWLNAPPEVQSMLRQEFDGVPISKQNLSQWRQGGFQEWLLRQEVWTHVRDKEDFAESLREDREFIVADDVATVLAARYAALISRLDGEVDDHFEAKARVLNGLCRGVAQLQRGLLRGQTGGGRRAPPHGRRVPPAKGGEQKQKGGDAFFLAQGAAGGRGLRRRRVGPDHRQIHHPGGE
jgi:hypothetical protein